MIVTNPTHFIGARECPYTFGGKKLTELRRAKLRDIAKIVRVDPDGTKNDLLRRIISRLEALGAEKEIASG